MIADMVRRERALKRLKMSSQEFDVFKEALIRGARQASFATGFMPSNYPGMKMWGETNGALREGLSLLGWKKSNEMGQCLSLSPDGNVAVSASSGDLNTGRNTGVVPRFKNGKGQTMQDAAYNNRQSSLFDLFDEVDRPPEALPRQRVFKELWILLYRCDERDGRIYAEVSLLTDLDGKNCEWSERFILDPIDFEGHVELLGEMEEDDNDVIDIPLTLK